MPYAMSICEKLLDENEPTASEEAVAELRSVGRYILEHPAPPWMDLGPDMPSYNRLAELYPVTAKSLTSDSLANLGLCVITFLAGELHDFPGMWELRHPSPSEPLYFYVTRQFVRRGSRVALRDTDVMLAEFDVDLPPLPVPDIFQNIFVDWADGRLKLGNWPVS